METAVGQFLGEIDAAGYVIDCLPNMRSREIAKRTIPLVRQLQKARPGVPIMLVEDRTYANARFLRGQRVRHTISRKSLHDAFVSLKASGHVNIHYLTGPELLGKDGEATTDGSHPNDLGMIRYANAYAPALRKMLK